MRPLEGRLAVLLANLRAKGFTSPDALADALSAEGIFVEELSEAERGLIDRFLGDALALPNARHAP